jgi:cellulose synthase/poly-beta-1,6-N-acetylglucosamine synthase-like glycosyltransferase
MRLRRRKLALVIPGHNEEQVIRDTINTALRAGQNRRDTFVVSDASTDATAAIAIELLGSDHVLEVERSGKAGAVRTALTHFGIIETYTWVHIADADSVFSPTYFAVLKKRLDPKRYVAASGYVQSLPGGLISLFRVYEYTWANTIIRRIQAKVGIITVIPGPTSVFRTDIIDKLDFATGSLTEDFDITIQIHRYKLGRIQFIPAAKTYTQDPRTFADFIVQINRWYRGYFQGVRRYGLGRSLSLVDTYVGVILLQTLAYGIEMIVLLPLYIGLTQRYSAISVFFLSELSIYFLITLGCAIKAKRLDIMAAFPLFYLLRLVNLYIFFQAFVEVILLRGFREHSTGWSTAGRRYEIPAGSLK